MEENQTSHAGESIKRVSHMYKEWFLDYASYVILERAIPSIHDGLKPVQRRILHSMKELEDGRYNKVANIVGNTMKYHPHGDMAITDAMVQIGQKDLLIDTQGNWGNILTGDGAAASRYIEARLTKFALEVVFNPKTTNWQTSYDGRNNEPIDLPMKFPLLLVHGVEGIAVGLSTKILPHNFNEIIDASIKHLKGRSFILYPDFLTGGMIDVTGYNAGKRGGRVKVRAKIQKEDKNTLMVTAVPYNTTTTSVIDSIVRANNKGKIKIRKVEDNTSESVAIKIHLNSGTSLDRMIDALYAFTECEISISPNACVIEDDKPHFISINEILKENTDNTLSLLKRELEIELNELEEQWHFSSLERIFIDNKIYRRIEEEETWEGVIQTIDEGLKPFTQHLLRKVTEEDISRLTEIRIKRISKFDLSKAKNIIVSLEEKIEDVKHHLNNIIDYTIDYFNNLKKKYGKGKERKTEIKTFDSIDVSKVAAANVKLYVNREEGFIGTGLKKDELLFECSDLDLLIVIRENGSLLVTKIDNKTFVGKDVLHVAVWTKNDKRTVYNLIYKDGETGASYMKRFSVTSITRDKEYYLTQGTAGSSLLYFSANPNGEAETVQVHLRASQRLKKLRLDIDFSELAVKGRSVKGNLVSKHPVKKVELKERGTSTLAARKIWFDETICKLNTEERGSFLGEFNGEEKILTVSKDGNAQLTSFELMNHYPEDLLVMEKWQPKKPISCVYYDGDKSTYFIKRFLLEDTLNPQPFFDATNEESHIQLLLTDERPQVEIVFRTVKGNSRENETIVVDEFISVKGIKAQGNIFTKYQLKQVNVLDSLPALLEEAEVVETEAITEKNSSEASEETSSKEQPKDDDIIIEGDGQSSLDF